MGKFIDFAALKESVSIEDAMAALRLVMKPGNNQFRGACPACKAGGDRALVITPAKSAFYCFGARKGGDQIALVAHINNLSTKDAAEWLAQGTVQSQEPVQDRKSTVPESVSGQQGDRTLQPLSYLEIEHPAVEAVGFHPDDCAAIGIGYAPRGLMRGTVAVPIRLHDGSLIGYIGITEAKLPPRFLLPPNVVRFPKTA